MSSVLLKGLDTLNKITYPHREQKANTHSLFYTHTSYTLKVTLLRTTQREVLTFAHTMGLLMWRVWADVMKPAAYSLNSHLKTLVTFLFRPSSHLATCILGDPITSGQLEARHFTPDIRMHLHVRLEWPLVIGSHSPTLYANTHAHHCCLQTPNAVSLFVCDWVSLCVRERERWSSESMHWAQTVLLLVTTNKSTHGIYW